MIRKANLNDVYSINEICQSTKALISTTDDNNYISWLSQHVISDSLLYVYEIDNKIVGFILGEKMIGHGLMVWMTGVYEEFNNKGIGVRLYNYLENAAKNIGIKWLIIYGYMDNDVVHKILVNKGYNTNNNIYKEYFKFL